MNMAQPAQERQHLIAEQDEHIEDANAVQSIVVQTRAIPNEIAPQEDVLPQPDSITQQSTCLPDLGEEQSQTSDSEPMLPVYGHNKIVLFPRCSHDLYKREGLILFEESRFHRHLASTF